MKRVFSLLLTGIVISVAASTIAAAQSQPSSLGDYARAVRKSKPKTAPTAKSYDNDNLPNLSTLSVVGKTSEPAAEARKDDAKDKDAEAKANPDDKSDAQKKAENSGQTKPGQSPEDRQKAFDVWKQKIDAQKDKLDLLSRELDVLQREEHLKQAEFYADTATRVRTPSGFADEDAKYKQQIADKQKAVDEAKAKLADLQDGARKAGVPNSVAEQ
jgi:hypothetical protein